MKVQGIIHGEPRCGYWLVSEPATVFKRQKDLLNHCKNKGMTVLGKAFSGKVYVMEKGKWQIKSQLDLWE